ncbi:MAG: hypothetical protein PHU40_05165 [Sulfurimonas sp.]|nr:hypothetical protein [Sulfurimonas sp.]
MKFFKILLLLITFQSVSSASYLLDANSYCIEDYYSRLGSFYYLRSDNNTWYATTTDKYAQTVIPNYTFSSSDNSCRPDFSTKLGMTIEQFNFLLGLIGVIFGGVFMYFSIQAFMAVGGKR